MAPTGCRSIDMRVDILLLQHDHLIHQIYHITSLAISHHNHSLQKQVRRPLILLLRVLRGDQGYLVGSHLTYANTTTVMCKLLFNLSPRTASVKSNSTKVEETDTRQ